MKPNRFRFRVPSLFSSPLRYGAPVFAGLFVTFTGLDADAGDILRGGGGGNPNPSTGGAATSGGSGTPAATNEARANAADTLARTTRTLDAMKAMQAAARAAAIAGPNQLGTTAAPLPIVPNGVGVGGLNPAALGTDPLKPQKNVWTGAQLQPANPADTTKVTIKQSAQQALLYWETFNVGKETTLTFDQSAGGSNVGQWVAFNKVSDITANPTQILGNIKADGQIYIINPNGIIFGGSSQVNARGLTVSSLPINDNLIERGLLNNPDAQFLFTGLALPAGLNGTPSFTPEKPASGKYGNVTVQKGAILNSPTNSAKVGGRITLVGPNVTNEGSILTPDGQAILASGLQVGFDGHASSDPSLRGLDVFVGAVEDPTAGLYAGTITQNGVIESPRGSITIAGKTIQQNGALSSTTSVSLNGRIDIQAQYNAVSTRTAVSTSNELFVFKETGAVNLGDNSLIRILPEYESKETTIGTVLALRSKINVTGKTIYMGKGSVLLAPNAEVNLNAGKWLFVPAAPASAPVSTFVQSGGQIYLDEDAQIDVAGSYAVPVSVTQNIISVDLRSAELADSPLQRLGTLRNATVEVDIRNTGDGWIGTPLADVSGFANLIQRSVGQLTVAGGSVTIKSGGSVVMQEGSNIEVSGGSTLFEGGMVRTTKLLTGGRLVDIGSASPDVVYDGIFDGTFTEPTAPKFGVTNVFDGVQIPAGYQYEAGYTEGAAGGKISITSPSMALDGSLKGTTVTGERQRQAVPAASTLQLAFLAQDTSYRGLPIYSPTPPVVTFTTDGTLTPAAPFSTNGAGDPAPLSTERLEKVFLSPELFDDAGFGVLTINNYDGSILIPEDVILTAAGGSVISFTASVINIDGGISVPDGKLTFNSPNLSLSTINRLDDNPTGSTLPTPVDGRGVFKLGDKGVISTRGLIVDDRLRTGTSGTLPLFLGGGSVSINAHSAELAAGGLLDVSGGVYVDPRGAVSYGNAGSLAISAGRDLAKTAVLGGRLKLGATLSGFSGAKAGSLSLQAPAFQIGGSSSNTGVNVLNAEFFNQGGFGIFSIGGLGLASGVAGEFVAGVSIAPQTTVHPVVSSWVADTSDGGIELRVITRDEGVRTAGSLSFGALGAIDTYSGAILGRGNILVAEGAAILTDAKGAVSFNADTITVNGSVTSSGGTITVTGAAIYPSLNPDTLLPTVLFGDTARLSTAGKVVLISNAFNLRQGEVVAGGTITVSGNIVASRGATLDVSGTSGVLDLPPSRQSLNPAVVNTSSGRNYVPVTVDSNGGRITLSGSRMLYSDATLIGRAGGASAIGGSLSVSSGRFVAVGTESNTAQTNLVVRQDGFLVPVDFPSKGTGVPLTDSNGAALPGIGNFTVSTFASGGFDSLSLNGNVAFNGDVSIQTSGALRIASGGVVSGLGNINLRAGYINLGQAFATPSLATETAILFTKTDTSGTTSPYFFAPNYGTGRLSLEAGLIDIGNLSLDGLGATMMNAAAGDIRGNGTLSLAGTLDLKAGQVYTTTAGRFDIFAYDFTSGGQPGKGTVSITGGTLRNLPLSAGGKLGVYASQITQAGVLRAPLGTIKLGWDGTGSSPLNPIAGSTRPASVTSLLTLAAGGTTSVSTIDPITGKAGILPYGISFDGKSWIDPAGNDITVSGVPGKTVNLAATQLVTEAGSTVDIGGGGDLYAYRWIAGNGGTEDILASSNSFAVIPGYGFNYSPYAPFNTSSAATNLKGAPGYTNTSIRVGDQITLAASKDLPAGTYTLLPARYALLPGAVLITPKTTVPTVTVISPAGASLVAGYRSNNLDPSRSGPTVISGFEVASADVFRTRASYQDLLANKVLRDATVSRGFSVPRLPVDAGYLAFTSTAKMTLNGRVTSLVPESGRGSLIDINSSSDIFIGPVGAAVSGTGLQLDVGTLNSFGAESLLIGGLRTFGADGVSVTVNSAEITLDNAGSALTGEDIVLVSRETLTLAEGSEIITAENEELLLDTLLLGESGTLGSGNGSLVRVSANASGRVSRTATNTSSLTELAVRSGVTLTGGSIVLDSSSGTSLADSARLFADDVSLNSGQISISLNDPGILNPTTGLVLAGDALASLQSSVKRLALLSYSTIDTYGTGVVGTRDAEGLSLQSAAVRGFNTNGGAVTFTARNLTLGNSANSPTPALPAGPLAGSAIFDADQITLGANATRLDGFANVTLAATAGVLTENQGSLEVTGDLDLVTPRLTGASASKYQISAKGALEYDRPAVFRPTPFNGGLGADITLQGGSVKVDADITLPSGKLTLRATSGDLLVGRTANTVLDLAGTSSTFIDVIRYTSGGTVNLISDAGSVRVGASATINVSAKNGGGNAGTIQAKTPAGVLDLAGVINGTAGTNAEKGKFSLDTGSITGGSLASLDAVLNAGSFTQSRTYRVRNGNVNIDGPATSRVYRVSADSGNITVSNTINASGTTGGVIDLKANGSLTLTGGSLLNASGSLFDSAGKGGSVTLEAGNQRNGSVQNTSILDLQTGSSINLAVAEANAGSQALGKFTGTLHLRAPRNAANTDLRINAIGSSIQGASAILMEGVKLYDLTGSGTITSTVQTTIRTEAQSFLGTAGTTTAGYTAMLNRLTSLQTGLDLILAPGAEILNRSGNLTLGTSISTASSDWNLASFRFGPKSVAGVLTLRASGNLTFFNALSDGFSGGTSLWLAPLMAQNPLLPANMQSWSYRMAAGADSSAADFRSVLPAASLGSTSGLLQLGKNAGAAVVTGGGGTALTSSLITNFYQVIRTGSGNIDISTGGNLQLLNQFASIYTAGTRLANSTTVGTANDFLTPIIDRNVSQTNLGSAQQNYPAQYSMAGGNVTISSAGNIERKTANNSGLIDDSSRQLPNNWLYRRSYVDGNGDFGRIRIVAGISPVLDQAASTTWWVDFSNFFQDVGALGGGNVTMSAAQDIMNVSAAIPTNARAARGNAATAAFVELGGGDLRVNAGRDISGGVYYVERGSGTLDAAGSITTNATRSPSFGLISNINNPAAAQLGSLTWLPTTLFVGKSSFNLTAAGDLLLGPVSNPFLLPQGINNRFWYKTHFSTLSPESSVTALSLGGDLTYRNSATVSGTALPMLRAWNQSQLLYSGSATSAAWFQPWLRLAETSLVPFSPVWSLSASNLSLTSFSADLNLVGDLTSFPSPVGQIEILAAGSIRALQPTGISTLSSGLTLQNWISSTINLSDANPSSVPKAIKPLTSVTPLSSGAVEVSSSTVPDFMSSLAAMFVESGSITGTNAVLQTRQARHTPGGLHFNDAEPLRIYALDGSLSGLTLFSGKQARITASSDITDVAFYIQNNAAADVSIVTAGRDITAYNSASPLRVASLAPGNTSAQPPLSGDIQISGPGTLQVLAGRNLDLGIGANNADGTGTGITSIGNLRNPFLTAEGADLLVGAGIGPATSLAGSSLDFEEFIARFATSPGGDRYLAEAKGILGVLNDYEGSQRLDKGVKIRSVSPGGPAEAAGLIAGDVILTVAGREITKSYDDSYLLSGIPLGETTSIRILRDGNPLELMITPGSNLLDLTDPTLTSEQQKQIALSLFQLILRDTGRDFNDPDSEGYRNYDSGFEAIKTLFPESSDWEGEILTQSRDIRTRSGGNISIIAPGGGLTMADTTLGNPLTPPGIVTESGGSIAVFADQSVGIGIGRIFTLKGGDVSLWSSEGDIAAGSSSRTVAAAPPTRVVIDPQSASVETDLAGLATGGGIGVLATVAGVEPGDVDLIAPTGIIDAGDAGIRVSGNINLAAVTVVNAGNISAGGSSTGAPVAASAPSISTVTSASNTAAAASSTVTNPGETEKAAETEDVKEEAASLYTVEVIGYGGGSADEEDEDQLPRASGPAN